MIKFFKRQRFFIKIIIILILAVGVGLLISSGVNCSEGKSCLASIKESISGSSDDSKEEDIFPIVELIQLTNFAKNNFAISATGQLESIDQVEIRSQVSSKVRRIDVSLGETVSPGQILVVFENDDISAQLMAAQAGLEGAEAQLAEMEKGARTEELKIVEDQVKNAELSFREAEQNLENTKNKVQADLENIYSSALNTLISAGDAGKNSLLFVSDLQHKYFDDYSQESVRIARAKSEAILALLGENNGGRWNRRTVADKEGGVYSLVKNISPDSFEEIDQALLDMESALVKVKVLLDVIPSYLLDDFDKASLFIEKSVINGQKSSVSGIRQGISVQRAGNNSLLTAAQMSYIGAQTGLESSQNQLNLLLAGASSEQLAAQRARVKSAQAMLNQARSGLEKTIIRSPIRGKISIFSVRLGELINPGQLITSVVNSQGLEVKVYIDSSNLSFIGLNNRALIENEFSGVVTNIAPSIDPLKKKVEVRVVLLKENQSELVIGQFVNVSISANEESLGKNVYLLPLKSVRITPQGNFIYTLNQDNIIVARLVETGRVIGDSVEVTDGLGMETNIIDSVRGLEPGQKVNIR